MPRHAEETIVALEAKLESTVNINKKKVSAELGKKNGRHEIGPRYKRSAMVRTGSLETTQRNAQHQTYFKEHMRYWCGTSTRDKCEKWRAHDPKKPQLP